MYSFFTTEAIVERQSYTGNKSAFSETGDTYLGYFKPASLTDVIDRDTFGKEYHFSTDYEADILDGDILIIDSKKYNVKSAIKKQALEEIKYTFCLLVND